MARAQQSASTMACVGMLAGMMLLGFAGTIVVLTPSSVVAEIEQASSNVLRRLTPVVDPATGAVPLVDPATGQPVLTTNVNTTTLMSLFDSSDTSSSSGSAFSSLESSKSSDSSSGSVRAAGLWLEQLIASVFGWMCGAGGQAVIMLCFAVIYHGKAVAPIIEKEGTLKDRQDDLPYSGTDDFENGIFSCFDDKWVCIHGFCCPLVRMAHTNAVAGNCGFWETAFAWCCCAMISANLGPCCLMVYWRKQVKETMGIEDHIMNDICCTLFCPLLSLCQQASAVDRAMGYEVTGCCDLEKL